MHKGGKMSISSKDAAAKSSAPSSPEESTSPRLLETAVVDAEQKPGINANADPLEPSSDTSSAEMASDMEPTEKESHLPGEMWLEILSYLPKKDLKNARLVKAAFAEFVNTHSNLHGSID